MSKKISILLTDIQYEQLSGEAVYNNCTLTDYIIRKLPIEQENKFYLNDIITKINKLSSCVFSLPSLYSEKEWSAYTKGSKLTIGKQFFKEVENGNIFGVEFVGENSANKAIYKKL